MKSEYEKLKSAYDADIRLIKSNPNTPADIYIDYKDITVYIGKALGDKYYLDIWRKHKPVFINATLLDTHSWNVVMRELDRYLPIKKQTSLF